MNEINLNKVTYKQIPDIEFYIQGENSNHFYLNEKDSLSFDSWLESKIGKFSMIEDEMVIFIPEKLKRKVLIRNVNKYIKDNKLNIKITNKKDEANTVAVESLRSYYYKSEPLILIDNKTNKYYNTHYWASYDKSRYTKFNCKVYTNYSINGDLGGNSNEFSIFGNVVDTLEKLDYIKLIDIKDLINISASVYKDKSVGLSEDIDVSLFEEMMKKDDSAELLCLSMKNRNIDPYLSDIVRAYYKSRSFTSRTIIRNKLLKYYGYDSKFYANTDSLRDHYYYMKTMTSLNLSPDKEVVLEMVGFYNQ